MSGRGICPICNRSGIKIIYEQEINEKKISCCKQCNSALKHGKLKDRAAAVV